MSNGGRIPQVAGAPLASLLPYGHRSVNAGGRRLIRGRISQFDAAPSGSLRPHDPDKGVYFDHQRETERVSSGENFPVRRGPMMPMLPRRKSLNKLIVKLIHWSLSRNCGSTTTTPRPPPAGRKFINVQHQHLVTQLYPPLLAKSSLECRPPIQPASQPSFLPRPIEARRGELASRKICPSFCGQIFQSKRLSLNRSQCGSCSTKYDTPTET